MEGERLLSVYPREIAYSQSSVGFTIYTNDEDPGVSVREWSNMIPYTIPIDVAFNENGDILTFDNRRLYAARNHAPTEQRLMVRQHEFTDMLSEDKIETSAANIFFWWEVTDAASGELEVHCIRAIVTYWGLLTALRCASQSPVFSLNGSITEPTVRRYKFPYTPYYELKRGGSIEIPIYEDAHAALIAALRGESIVCFSHSQMGVIMHRPDFNQMLLRYVAGIRATSYFKYAKLSMTLRAKGEKKDGHWPDDEEFFRAENERIEDIESLWLKADVAEVSLFLFSMDFLLNNFNLLSITA